MIILIKYGRFSLPSFVVSSDQTPETTKKKGRPRGRLHSDAQVSTGLGNTKT